MRSALNSATATARGSTLTSCCGNWGERRQGGDHHHGRAFPRNKAALAMYREGEEVVDLGRAAELVLAHPHQRVGAVVARTVNEPEGLLHRLQLLDGEAVALEADLVDGTGHGGIAVGDDEGRHVLHDLRHAAEPGVRPDAAELVHPRPPPDVGVVLHEHVAGERRLRAHDEMVAHHAVVRDVAVGQHHVVAAHACVVRVVGRAVHAHVFAKHVAVADNQAGFAALELEVVRLGADAGERKYLALRADGGAPLDVGVVVQHGAGADDRLGADVGVGADDDIRAQLRAGLDDGGGMDLLRHGVQSSWLLSTGANISSAAQTTWPPTLHSPSAQAMVPRTLVSLTFTLSWSPGRTGLRHFTLSQLIRRAVLPSMVERRITRMPAACAMASICSTPGITGLPG